MSSTWPRARGALVTVVLAVLAACGGSAGDRPGGLRENAIVEHLDARSEAATRVRWFDTVTDLLPNVRWESDVAGVGPHMVGVVVGRIESVSHGRAFRDGEPGSTEVAWDDPTADWRTLHLDVAVDERIGDGPASADRQVDVGLSIGSADPELLIEGLEDFGTVLLPLWRADSVFGYDEDRYGIALDGELLGTVTEGGAISFPVLDPDEERRFLGATRSVAALQLAASGPTREIRLDSTGHRTDPAR